jgi:hypothetical protein
MTKKKTRSNRKSRRNGGRQGGSTSVPQAVVTMREYVTLSSGGSGIYNQTVAAAGIFPYLKSLVTNNYDIIKWHMLRYRPILYTVAPPQVNPAGLLYGFSIGQIAPASVSQLPDVQETNFVTSRPWCHLNVSKLEQPTYDTGASLGFLIWGRSDGVPFTAVVPIVFEVEYRVTLSSPS